MDDASPLNDLPLSDLPLSDLAKTDAELPGYVDALLADTRERTERPAGFVPATHLWWVDGDRFLGRLHIRHRLNALPVAALTEPDDAVLTKLLGKFFRERNIKPPEDLLTYLVWRIEMAKARPHAA